MSHVADKKELDRREAHEHGVGHVVPPRVLVLNTIALLILTVITVAVAVLDFAAYDVHEMDVLIALAVATVKAALVCLFFMHLWWDRPFHGFVLVTSIAFVALFIGLALTDSLEYAHELLPGDAGGVTSRLQALEP